MEDSNAATKDFQAEESQQRTKKKLTPSELKKMPLQQRSRYLAYEEPPKHVAEAQKITKKRLVELKNKHLRESAPLSEEDILDKEKHAKLIGQLKAAESRNRLRIMRLRYQANRAQEISHLISCQPIALKAVRLQALVPPYTDNIDQGDRLDKLDRERVEKLLEDTKGLITNRVH
ncbi:protein LKAAEAR1-like [Gigantopelta aegis]|uniref:protein LKAAEAR1-like n=1 Tax=Gigantopelta aegis TaxID=1735272 RepID=UPI001B887C37|nr:protein LKAAEAR1-like [Gigantopelta aegis]